MGTERKRIRSWFWHMHVSSVSLSRRLPCVLEVFGFFLFSSVERNIIRMNCDNVIWKIEIEIQIWVFFSFHNKCWQTHVRNMNFYLSLMMMIMMIMMVMMMNRSMVWRQRSLFLYHFFFINTEYTDSFTIIDNLLLGEDVMDGEAAISRRLTVNLRWLRWEISSQTHAHRTNVHSLNIRCVRVGVIRSFWYHIIWY